MEDTIALIKAISYLIWPICLLLMVFMFRQEIKALLLNLIKTTKINVEIAGEMKQDEQTIPLSTGEEKNISLQRETEQITNEDQIVVEVCKNNSSGKYSVILDENKDKIYAIAPDGNINWFEKKLFNETIKDITIDMLAQNQQEKFYWWIQREVPANANMGKVIRQPIEGYLPSYIRMLNNPNTEPSRMLNYIKSKERASWFETKDFLHDKYNYEINTSGSLGASLKALEALNCVKISGQGDNKIITYSASK